MPPIKPEWEHFCLLVFAQDSWNEKDYSKISDSTFENYLLTNKHKDCDICLTCSICRSLWDLFDPYNLGEYNFLCPICENILAIFEEQKGTNDGLILFSHNIPGNNEVISFVNSLLDDKKIKKLYIFKHEITKTHLRDEKLPETLQRKMKKIEFLEHLEGEKFAFGVIYEILKDRYY